MTVDAAGNLFFSSLYGTEGVRRITPAGVETLVTSAIPSPSALAVGRDGTIYVASPAHNSGPEPSVVWRISPKPNPADGYEAPVRFRADFPVFFFRALEVDSQGNVYALVASKRDGNNIPLMGPLQRISPDGQRTEIPTTLNSPWGMTVDQQDNVYVSDFGDRLIRVY